MDDTIKHYITIIVEVLLVATILSFVSILSIVSKNVSNTIAFESAAKQEIQEYKELYKYDDKNVKGSDIPKAVLNYIRYYEFEVVNGSEQYNINTTVENTMGEKIWTQEYIVNDVLGDNIYNNYRATLIRDYQDHITGIRFVME